MVWIATRSLTGLLVATTMAPALMTPRFGLDAGVLASFDPVHVRAVVDLRTVPLGGIRHSLQILHNVKLALTGKSKRRSGIERCDRRAIDARDARQSRPVRGLQLSSSCARSSPGGDEQVPVQPGEVAIDLLVAHDAFDLVNGRCMALRRQTGAFVAMQPFEMIETVVQRAHEMRRRPACLTTGGRTIVHDDRALTLLRQQVCGCEPRDACADDADVGMCV